MSLTILRRPWLITLKPGVLALYAALALGGGALIAVRRLQLAGQMSATWQEAALAGVLALAGLFIHETGHAVAAQATGRTVERLEFGLAGGALTSGATTPWRRAAAIVAGPVFEIAFGSLLWTAGDCGWDNPAGAAGLISLINGISNLLPLHRSLDGYRLLPFIVLAVRGNIPLACTAAGQCPACTGAPAEQDRLEHATPLTV